MKVPFHWRLGASGSARLAGLVLAFGYCATSHAQTLLLPTFGDSQLHTYSVGGSSITPGPTTTLSVGGNPLPFPAGIAVDPSGNIYVGDALSFVSVFTPTPTFDPNIYEFNSNGGGGSFFTALPDPYGTPTGLAWNNGSLYVADLSSNTIERFDSAGNDQGAVATLPGGPGADQATAIVFDSHGNMYATGYSSGNVYEFPALGGGTFGSANVLINGATNDIFAPLGLAISPDGTRLYVSNSGLATIESFDLSGNLKNADFANFSGLDVGALSSSPSALLFAPDGSLLVAVTGSSEFLGEGYLVQLVLSGGSVADTNIIQSGLVGPTALAFDAFTVPEPGSWFLAFNGLTILMIAALRQRAFDPHARRKDLITEKAFRALERGILNGPRLDCTT